MTTLGKLRDELWNTFSLRTFYNPTHPASHKKRQQTKIHNPAKNLRGRKETTPGTLTQPSVSLNFPPLYIWNKRDVPIHNGSLRPNAKMAKLLPGRLFVVGVLFNWPQRPPDINEGGFMVLCLHIVRSPLNFHTPNANNRHSLGAPMFWIFNVRSATILHLDS